MLNSHNYKVIFKRAALLGLGARGSLSRVIEIARQLLKTRRPLVLRGGGAALLVLALLLRGIFGGAVAQGPAGPRPVSVAVATASMNDVRVRLEALGTVTPIASVAIKTRVDSEIAKVHF